MKKEKHIYCPTCGNQCIVYFDPSCGPGLYHLHCKTCDIHIHTSHITPSRSIEKAEELLQEHHIPHTTIEFYDNKILWYHLLLLR